MVHELTERLEHGHSNRMWCRAVHLNECVWKTQRRSSVLGVVDLTHTCTWVVQREAALVTQPRMVIGQVRHTHRAIWTGMLFLSSATCVSVTVGFVPPQSLTHVDYLYLRGKANASHILCASNQALKHNISFPFVDRIF